MNLVGRGPLARSNGEQRRGRCRFCAPLVVATLVATGCAKPALSDRQAYDLVALFDSALLRQEASTLLGVDSGRVVSTGLAIGQRSAQGAISVDAELGVRFFAAAPRDLRLTVDCRPLGAASLDLLVLLNGTAVAEMPILHRSSSAAGLDLPARLISPGENLVRLAAPQTDGGAGKVARPQPRFRCASIEIDGLEPVGPARANLERGEILLPFGTQIEYFMELRPGDALLVDHLRAARRGSGRPGSLSVVLEELSSGSIQTAEWSPTENPVELSWPIPVDRAGKYRVLLRPSAPGGDRSTVGFRVIAPRLVTRRASRADVPRQPPRRATRPPALSEVRGQPVNDRPVNVVIYVVDTLRADHLGCYGYDRPTSPNFDALARDGTLFEHAIATSSWTRPTVASILTGLHPQRHGANDEEDAVGEGVETLAGLLQHAGYGTTGFITNGNVHGRYGFSRGFDEYRFVGFQEARYETDRSSVTINEAVAGWLPERPARKPFFLYLHTIDPHLPYQAEEPWRGMFASGVTDPSVGEASVVRAMNKAPGPTPSKVRRDLIDLYDAEIAANDHAFGRLVAMLKEAGIYDSSLLIVVADHGEEFHDHGRWGHGATLYHEQIHVPLVIKWPGGFAKGTRVAETASQVDIVPTVLDTLGLSAPAELDGLSLLPLLSNPGDDRLAYSLLQRGRRDLRSVTTGRWKLIENFRRGGLSLPVEIYALGSDPRETQPLGAGRPALREYLLHSLETAWSRPSFTSRSLEPPQDPELRRNLEALGYL